VYFRTAGVEGLGSITLGGKRPTVFGERKKKPPLGRGHNVKSGMAFCRKRKGVKGGRGG